MCISIFILLNFFCVGCCNDHIGTDYSPSDMPSEIIDSASELITKNGSGEDNLKSNCKLIVLQNDISSKSYVFIDADKNRAELPLIEIIKEIGAQINWQDEMIANIVYDNKKYVLYTNLNSMYEEGNERNLIAPPPGTQNACFKFVQDQYIVGSSSIRYLMEKWGFNINIDFEQFIITIE